MKKFLAMLGATLMIVPAFALADTFSHSLSVGARSSEVSSLQQVLVTLGFLTTAPTGYFGPLTRQAVILFQKANRLDPVGIVGPKTRMLLNARVTQATPPIISPAPASSTSSLTPSASTSTPSTAAETSASTTTTSTLTISIISPLATLPAQTTYTTLMIATNRPATCRYGTTSGMEFTSMMSLGETGVLLHSREFSNLSIGGWYVYYVKCEDAITGTISSETKVSFKVAAN